jgi:hydroxyacylglutathione hydrolase
MHIERIQVGVTNCYLLCGRSGTVILDPGPPRGAPTVISRAAEIGVQPDDVHLILVSHGHLDHYGAAAAVKDWCGAPLAAGHGESEFSRERRNALPPAQTLRGSLFRWFYLLLTSLTRPLPLEADLILDSGTDLSPYGLDARVLLLPGHSPGSLGVITAGRDALVGDLFVNYTLPSQPLYLWDRAAWQQSWRWLRALAPRTVYVGHGEPFPGDRLEVVHPARYQLRWWVR